jgi:hypothetical protein
MKTKVNEKSEHAIIVEGVVLTKAAIETLKGLQEEDNSLLKGTSCAVCKAICNMIQLLDTSEQDSFRDKITQSVVALTYVNEYLEDLQKP